MEFEKIVLSGNHLSSIYIHALKLNKSFDGLLYGRVLKHNNIIHHDNQDAIVHEEKTVIVTNIVLFTSLCSFYYEDGSINDEHYNHLKSYNNDPIVGWLSFHHLPLQSYTMRELSISKNLIIKKIEKDDNKYNSFDLAFLSFQMMQEMNNATLNLKYKAYKKILKLDPASKIKLKSSYIFLQDDMKEIKSEINSINEELQGIEKYRNVKPTHFTTTMSNVSNISSFDEKKLTDLISKSENCCNSYLENIKVIEQQLQKENLAISKKLEEIEKLKNSM